MRYCGPRGIPLSTFLGWAQEDQDAALAWQAHEAERCPGCGRHPDDPPSHPHVGVCPSCRAQALQGREVDRAGGEHLVWEPGYAADCPQCHPKSTSSPVGR